MKYGLTEEKADICARIHTESTYDGIYSHGTNRVARFVDYIQKGWVDPNAEPTLEREAGAIRIYNGNLGPGILNALYGADRAMELADQYGIGMVGLKNTTHWMRGGTYGKYAAEKGYVAIMWTNTEACMPPWGAKEIRRISRRITPSEYGRVLRKMEELGFDRGYTQELSSAKEEYVPPFDGTGV